MLNDAVQRAGVDVELGQVGAGLARDRVELATHVDGLAVDGALDDVDLAARSRVERAVQRTGGPVVGSQLVAGDEPVVGEVAGDEERPGTGHQGSDPAGGAGGPGERERQAGGADHGARRAGGHVEAGQGAGQVPVGLEHERAPDVEEPGRLVQLRGQDVTRSRHGQGADRGGGQVHRRDPVAGLAADGAEGADQVGGGAGGVELQGVDVPVDGEGEGVQGAGGVVHRGQALAVDPVHLGEVTGHEQAGARQLHVPHRQVDGAGGEPGHDRPGRQVHRGQSLARGVAADRGEVTAGVGHPGEPVDEHRPDAAAGRVGVPEQGTGGAVDLGQPGGRGTVEGGEVPAHDHRVGGDGQRPDHGVGGGRPPGDGAGGVHLGEVLADLPADRGEVTGQEVAARTVGLRRVHRAVHVGETGAEGAGAGVDHAGGAQLRRANLGEGATDDDAVADLGDAAGLAVDELEGPVDGALGHHAGDLGVLVRSGGRGGGQGDERAGQQG